MNIAEFITDARMHGWSKDDTNNIYSMLSFDVNPDVTEEQKNIKVGIYLFNAEFDAAAAKETTGEEDYSGFASNFYNCFNETALKSVMTGYANVGGETVGEILAWQQELIGAYQGMIDEGILTPNSLILPANGGRFTAAVLGVDYYDTDGNQVGSASFPLSAIPSAD